MKQTTWNRWIRGQALASLAMLGACGEGEGFIEPDRDLPPENRGIRSAASGLTKQSFLRWEDPAEIVATTAESPQSYQQTHQVRGVRVADGQARLRDGPHAAPTSYGSVEISHDGVELYSARGSSQALYHTRDGAEPLQLAYATGASHWPAHSPMGSVVLPTRHVRGAAYVAGDSVRLFDAVARTSRPVARGCSALLDFSPDESELLCRNLGVLHVVTMHDGAVRPLVLPAGRSFHQLVSVRWTGDGLKLLFPGPMGRSIEIVDASTGAATALVNDAALAADEMLDLREFAWAPDGKSVAFATSRCRSWLDCRVMQQAIYLSPVDGSGSRRIAAVNFTGVTDDAGLGELVFSPDGRRLAYVAGTYLRADLYLVSVP